MSKVIGSSCQLRYWCWAPDTPNSNNTHQHMRLLTYGSRWRLWYIAILIAWHCDIIALLDRARQAKQVVGVGMSPSQTKFSPLSRDFHSLRSQLSFGQLLRAAAIFSSLCFWKGVCGPGGSSARQACFSPDMSKWAELHWSKHSA